jgi:L-aminopeptidase/D-esterase-like protein
MKGLTDIPGIAVGHATDEDGITGCTVVVCPGGAVAGCDVRGHATGTQELDTMSPLHITGQIHAVALAGGSAFGLESASGVRRRLALQGVGFRTGQGVVPIVPGAILYDLGIGKPDAWPTREMGEVAAAAAHDGPVEEGSVGAGAGATVGKYFGIGQAMKGGVGTFTVELGSAAGGAKVSALAVVNAFGDVLDPQTGQVLAGTRTAPDQRSFAGTARLVRERGPRGGFRPANTTLVVVATDALLTKTQATQVARMAQQGMARAIWPVHSTMDGDVVFALSAGKVAAPVDAVGVAAAEAVAEAIARGVRTAKSRGGVPGLGG